MPPPVMPTGMRPPDPVVTSRYRVDFPKLSGVFTKAAIGGSAAITPIQYQYAGPDGRPASSYQPGLKSVPTITLERGMTSDLSAWQWYQEVLDGKMSTARVNGTISILDAEGKPSATFNVYNAWPSNVSMPALTAGQSTIGTESITLSCEGFDRVL